MICKILGILNLKIFYRNFYFVSCSIIDIIYKNNATKIIYKIFWNFDVFF